MQDGNLSFDPSETAKAHFHFRPDVDRWEGIPSTDQFVQAAVMQLFVEDYGSHVFEAIQTRMRANQERRGRKILDDTLINL
jgi:hypothetical protein